MSQFLKGIKNKKNVLFAGFLKKLGLSHVVIQCQPWQELVLQ